MIHSSASGVNGYPLDYSGSIPGRSKDVHISFFDRHNTFQSADHHQCLYVTTADPNRHHYIGLEYYYPHKQNRRQYTRRN
jgi:hypothetical protein